VHDAGIGVGGLITTVKVVSMVSAACAVAMVVQGWHATSRSRHARLALTVLAGPLFLTGLVGDGFVGSAAGTFWATAVCAAVATLWLGPNRIWFGDPAPVARQGPAALRRPDPFARGGPPPSSQIGPPPPPSPTQTTGVSPGAAPPATWAPPPTSAYDASTPYAARPQAQPQSRPQSGPQSRPLPRRRPRALLWACLLTWVCTGLAATGLAISIAMMSSDSDSVMHDLYRQDPQLAQQGLSQREVLAMLYVISTIVLLAAVAAAVFAILVYLRRAWAWYALVVSACAATLLFLVGSFGSPLAIVLLGASVATLACLVRPEVRAWLLRR
jgi:hypothetical protein